MRIVVYKTVNMPGAVTIVESTGETISSANPLELLTWLITDEVTEYRMNPGSFRDEFIRVCWSLDDTVAPLLKLLGRPTCKQLLETKRVSTRPFSLFYIPGKIFSYRHVSCPYKLNLYGLDQFFPEEPYQNDIVQVQFYGQYLLKTLKEMGFEPTRLTSPIKVYEQHVLDYLDLPSAWDMPEEAAEYAWRCSGKLWIECHKLGYYETAFDYDIVSAFPTAASKLFDTRGCRWIKDSDFHDEAIYGYCKCIVTINDNVTVSPIIYTDKSGKSSSPVGTWESYLTKSEISFIRKMQIGEVSIVDGWWAIPERKLARPLEVVIARLLAMRQGGGLKAELAKRMAVGLYGKLGEEHSEEFGKHFNPCWFAEISSLVRLRVASFIYKYKLADKVIHISVDGVLSEQLVPIEENGGNGNWKLAGETSALVLSSGLVWQGSKKPLGLKLEQVKELIESKPRASYWETKLTRRVTLGQAIEGKFEDLGKEREMFTSIDLNVERDRYFSKLPKTGHQLLNKQYSSEPFKVKEVDNVQSKV